MRPLSWEWIAGFFDGEGSVSTSTNVSRPGSGQIQVSLAQAGEIGHATLVEIQAFLAGRGIKSYLGCKRNERIKDCWFLRVCSRPSIDPFLRGMYPYLRVKRVIALDTLRYLTAFPPIPQGTYFKELNAERKLTGWYERRSA